MREDGRLQMTLLGATTAVRLRGHARVDKAFRLRRFSFSLDPGTGPTEVSGTLENGTRLALTVRTPSGVRTRDPRAVGAAGPGPEPPARARRARPRAGRRRRTVSVFDPVDHAKRADDAARSLARGRARGWTAGTRLPRRGRSSPGSPLAPGSPTSARPCGRRARWAFSPCARRPSRRRRSPSPVRSRRTSSRPRPSRRAGRCASTTRRRSRACASACHGLDAFDRADLDGDGQTLDGGDVLEVRDPRDLGPGPAPADLARYLAARAVPRERRSRDPRRGGEGDRRGRRAPAAGRAPRAVRARTPREAADDQPALRARGAADARRRLQRAHGPLRGDGPGRGRAGARSRPASSSCAGPSTTTRGRRSSSRRRTAGAASGSRSTRRSTSSRPTPRTFALARGGLDRQAAIVSAWSAARGSTCSTSSFGRAPCPSSSVVPRTTCARSTCRCLAATAAAAGRLRRGARGDPRLADLVKTFGTFRAVDGVTPGGGARRDPWLPRPERRGQDDDDPHDRRTAEADGGAASRSTGTTSRREPETAKGALGFIPDRPFLYEKLTAAEFLRFHGGLYGLEGPAVEERASPSSCASSSCTPGATSSSRASRTA